MRRLIGAAIFALLSLAAGNAAAHPGTGIVVDTAGRVFFTDLQQIWRIDRDGSLRVVVPGKHCHTLALAADGTLSGEHVSYDGATFWTSAWMLLPDGRLVESVPPRSGPVFVFTPTVAEDGTRYYFRVDNNRKDRSEIFRQRPGGPVEHLAGGVYGWADGAGAAARFGAIGAMAAGKNGDLFVTDAPGIRRVAPDGSVTTLARGGRLLDSTLPGRVFKGAFGGFMGIALGDGKDVYVANFGGRRVVRVTPGAMPAAVLTSEAPWAPAGLAFGGGGKDLYVLEAGAWPGFFDAVRVRRVRDRKAAVLAVIRGGRKAS